MLQLPIFELRINRKFFEMSSKFLNLNFLQWVGENFGYPEFGSRSMWGRFVSNLFCQSGAPTQIFCSTKLYLLAGFSNDIDLVRNRTIINQVSNVMNFMHILISSVFVDVLSS